MELKLSLDETLEYELKRKDYLYDFCKYFVASGLHAAYNFDFQGIDNISGLENKGFILLPRHESYFDGIVEGEYIDRAINRRISFTIKKAFQGIFKYLPKILRAGGALPVLRGQEVMELPKQERKAILEREERKRAAVEEGELRGKCYLDPVVTGLLDMGEVVVIHPEGASNDGAPFAPRMDLLKRITELKTVETPICVPLDIRYDLSKARPEIYACAGTPLQTRDPAELYRHVMNWVPATYLKGERYELMYDKECRELVFKMISWPVKAINKGSQFISDLRDKNYSVNLSQQY